jgi:hypothetical protein
MSPFIKEKKDYLSASMIRAAASSQSYLQRAEDGGPILEAYQLDDMRGVMFTSVLYP